MREFNLFNSAQPKSTNFNKSALEHEQEKGISIPEKLIELIIQAKSPQEREDVQRELDQIFTDERRQALFQQASTTALETPAIYYRYMPREQLLQLLQSGVHTPQDYIERGKKADAEDLAALLSDFYNELLINEGLEREKRRVAIQRFKELTLQEQFLFFFPEVPQVIIDDLLHQMDIAKFQKFFDSQIKNGHKRGVHALGCHGLVFSNMLSASAGGPVVANFGIRTNDVYIEFVAPDNKVITHSADFEDMGDTVNTEKEVFFRQIPLQWITRIYLDKKQMMDETVNAPESSVSRYTERHPLPTFSKETRYRQWLKQAQIRDVIPKALAARYTAGLRRT